MMKLRGIRDLSLSDWPGKSCTLIFLQGCNLRCPWCFNVDAIDPSGGIEENPSRVKLLLETVRPLVDSVMLSGGEPLLQPDACAEILKIGKELEFKTGIETNGTLPENLGKILKFLDLVALDVKMPLSDEKLYQRMVGIPLEGITRKIKKTLECLKKSKVEFEVRTTLVPSLNAEPAIVRKLVRDLEGQTQTICFQQFRNQRTLDPALQRIPEPSREQLISLAKLAKGTIPHVKIFTVEGGFEEI